MARYGQLDCPVPSSAARSFVRAPLGVASSQEGRGVLYPVQRDPYRQVSRRASDATRACHGVEFVFAVGGSFHSLSYHVERWVAGAPSDCQLHHGVFSVVNPRGVTGLGGFVSRDVFCVWVKDVSLTSDYRLSSPFPVPIFLSPVGFPVVGSNDVYHFGSSFPVLLFEGDYVHLYLLNAGPSASAFPTFALSVFQWLFRALRYVSAGEQGAVEARFCTAWVEVK